MKITPETVVADLAGRFPSTITVFERHGIDFCCGGDRPLAEACADEDVVLETVLGELEATAADGQDRQIWAEGPLSELVDHIVERYHGAARRDLPSLGRLAEKVADRHGDRWPGFREVRRLLAELTLEMEAHMEKEETVLFPLVVQMERAESGPAGLPFVPLDGPIEAMEDDHEQVAGILGRFEELTDGFAAPEGSCRSVLGLVAGLEGLAADTRYHIHLENNVLFPRARDLARRRLGLAG